MRASSRQFAEASAENAVALSFRFLAGAKRTFETRQTGTFAWVRAEAQSLSQLPLTVEAAAMSSKPRPLAPPIPSTLSERVRTARRKAGLSQATLATRLGIRRAAVTQWEHPQGTQPSVANLRQAALELHVAFEWLATGRGPAHAAAPQETAFSAECIAQGADEELLLASYRSLSSRQREGLLAFLRTLKRT
jgi:transcriptional regulator with XRE-family HTH domain